MRQISIPGKYNAKVEAAEIRQSETTGAYYLYLEFVTDDGEFTSKRLYLSEKAIEYSVKNLNEVFDFDGDFATVAKQLIGMKCRIVIAEAENDEGKRYLEVRFINRIGPKDSLAGNDAISKLSSIAKSTLSTKKSNNPF